MTTSQAKSKRTSKAKPQTPMSFAHKTTPQAPVLFVQQAKQQTNVSRETFGDEPADGFISRFNSELAGGLKRELAGRVGGKLSRRRFVRVLGVASLALLSGSATSMLSGCTPASDVLRVGTKIDVPGFGFQNPETGNIEGMEVDIARELAKRIKGNPDALEVIGVNVTTRGAMLDNNTLDATLATFTITDERKKSYNFSRVYYTDHIGILVKKTSGITTLADLDGKTIGVALSATTREKLTAAGDEIGIHMHFAEYSTYPEIKIALVTGRVDAFSVDQSILNGYVDESTMLLDTHFAPQEYGVATKKSNTDLAAQIDGAIGAMQDDGTLRAIQQRWGLVDNGPESTKDGEALPAASATTSPNNTAPFASNFANVATASSNAAPFVLNTTNVSSHNGCLGSNLLRATNETTSAIHQEGGVFHA